MYIKIKWRLAAGRMISDKRTLDGFVNLPANTKKENPFIRTRPM